MLILTFPGPSKRFNLVKLLFLNYKEYMSVYLVVNVHVNVSHVTYNLLFLVKSRINCITKT